MLIVGPVLVPLFTGLLTTLLPRHVRLRRGVSLLGAVALLLCAIVLIARVIADGRQSVALGNWPPPYAIELAADLLSAGLVLITALLGAAVLVYEWRWSETTLAGPGLHPLVHVLLASTAAVFLAADLFNLYVWFELMLVSVLGLLVLGGGRRNLEAAFKYFAIGMFGTLLFLSAVGMIYGATGQLNLAALREVALRPEVASALPVYVGLLLLAFLLKAGAFPLFSWLPATYHTLPTPVLALIGGLLSKVAAYVVLRLLADVFVATPDMLIEVLGWLAMVTMAVGVLGAAYHWDLRRILSFHIVSQIGYLLFGIALVTPAGGAGTVYFLFHNIIVKANLFLIAGLMWAAAGHYDLRRIGGLYRARPFLALLFLVNAFSLVGMPPTSGFWGKFMLLREAFAQGRFVWGGMALVVGLLTLYSMSKIWLEGFWKAHPLGPSAAEATMPMPAYAVVGGLSVLILCMGIFPEPFVHFAVTATESFWATGAVR